MPNLRFFGLLSGVVALIAIACGGSSAESAGTGALTSATSSSPPVTSEAPTPTWIPPTKQRLAPDPLFDPTPTPRPTLSGVTGKFVEVAATGLVEQDPDYEEGLKNARFSLIGWKTDFSYHTVPFDDFLSGGPP